MRSTTLLVSTFLCASALAQPFQQVDKRDETRLVNEYQKDNTLVREFEVVHKVYVPAGGNGKPQTSEKAETPVVETVQQPKEQPKEQPQEQPKEQPKKVYKHKSSGHRHGNWKPQQKQATTQPQQEAKVQLPKEEPKEEPKVQPQQEAKTQPQQTTDNSDSASSGNGDLDIVNKFRKQWNSDLPPYKWSEKLYSNIKKCVDANPNSMVHSLGPGSFGQVLAPTNGDLGEAMTMWLCEMPGGSLNCPNGQTKGIGENPQGHAQILKDTSHAYIACYGTGKVVGCDVGDA